MASSSQKNELVDIFAVRLSKSKSGAHIKALTILTDGSTNELFVDIRLYYKGKPTSKFISLTEGEYNWMVEKLNEKLARPYAKDRASSSVVIIKFPTYTLEEFSLTIWKTGVVKLRRNFRGYGQTIQLSKSEVDTLRKDFTTFDTIIDVFESQLKSKV